jgi:hypothetical protein
LESSESHQRTLIDIIKEITKKGKSYHWRRYKDNFDEDKKRTIIRHKHQVWISKLPAFDGTTNIDDHNIFPLIIVVVVGQDW